ncbi:4-hydroxybenzoate polyprenyl transferase [Calocera cornea HHB12733]|uniref:4-hydroxybenzoate polyprenyltransferase, mitochondrial n=1 Tax=Calocera cornea HHB12733 TaxID=1353952 RepID=A0A165EZJ4_9BASI|nr:4-hydroxybenzoate polyprenyl transferase [Calocera cornea HHB12733]
MHVRRRGLGAAAWPALGRLHGTAARRTAPELLPRAASRTPTPTPTPSLKWPLSALPARTHPYLLLTRLDKPTGTLLLLLPCTWSIALAAHTLALPPATPLAYTLLFAIGAFVMRGAGCTVNDMWDRRLDRLVDRTRLRPLAANQLSLFSATSFLGLQLLLGLGVLTQLNLPSILLGAASLPLVALYPLMKRVTYWPQAVLGLTFNWGALLGYCALAGTLDWAVVGPLYAAGWCWTIVYDTIYAHQDKADDLSAGIRSTALLFGARTLPVLAGFSTAMLACLAAAGHAAGLGPAYYALSLGGPALLLARILRTTDWESRQSCWTSFAANTWVGALVAAGIWADYLWEGRWRTRMRGEGEGEERARGVGGRADPAVS